MTTIEHDPHEGDEKPELVPAPEGVEFAMRVFIRCDATNITHVLNFPGNRFHPPVGEGEIDVAELIDSLPPDEARPLRAMGVWRVMTRPEITRYKQRMVRAARGHQEH